MWYLLSMVYVKASCIILHLGYNNQNTKALVSRVMQEDFTAIKENSIFDVCKSGYMHKIWTVPLSVQYVCGK